MTTPQKVHVVAANRPLGTRLAGPRLPLPLPPLLGLLVLLDWLLVCLEKFDDLSLRAQMKLEETL